MALIDWLIVLGLNGAVIVYGFYLARGTKTSSEWFLGSRALPWWLVGLSMFATNIDNADVVSATGATFTSGLNILVVHTLGSTSGALLAAFCIVPAMYRAGLYTNAEYLEMRFGPSMRILSGLIQIQYRTNVLGLMIWSVYLLLLHVVGMEPHWAWTLIISMALLSGAYTAWGGLRAVVVTDALQAIIMMIGAGVVFFAVHQAAGGWHAMLEKLATIDPAQAPGLEVAHPSDLAHISSFRGEQGNVPVAVVIMGWIIIGSGYWSVNHTQTMRLMGSRSLWDMKLAAVVGVGVSIPIVLVSTSLGLYGRALFPDFTPSDGIYPHLAATYLGPGFKGLVVAAIIAAAMSTFDSMGSALSALFTRDIYARLIAKDRDDGHYVKVSRFATIGIFALGFAYLPFIQSKPTMLEAFRSLIPVFVTPLFGVYLIGTLTNAPRRSGIIALLCGAAYGVLALYDREFQLTWMPDVLTTSWTALICSLVLTLTGGLVASLLLPSQAGELVSQAATGWLGRTRETLPDVKEHPFKRPVPFVLQPLLHALALLAVSAYLVFGIFW
jgi:SSS family solute:Na+ symporter